MNLLKEYRQFLKNKNLSATTVRSYYSDVNKLLKYLSKDKLKLTKDNINSYADYLLSNNVPLRSVNRTLSSIRSFNEFLIEIGFMNHEITFSNLRKQFIQKEFGIIEEKYSKYYMPLFMILIFAALLLNYTSGQKNYQVPVDPKQDGFPITLGDSEVSLNQEDKIGSQKSLTYINSINIQGASALEKTSKDYANDIFLTSSSLNPYSDSVVSDDISIRVSGSALFASNSNSIKINHPMITKSSFVYLTPRSPLNGNSIYVSEINSGYFIANIENTISENQIAFDWFIQ